jgi:hypothetical protein
MRKGLFALLLAGTFMVPHIDSASGGDGTVGLRVQEESSPTQSWGALPLAPVPHLDTMPWLTSDFLLKGPKVDVLLGSRVETVGPFLVAPSTPPRQFSFNGGITE